jgi:hypothetical protein
VFSRPIVYNWRNYFIFTQSGDNIQAFFSLARTFHNYSLTSRRTSMFPNDMTLYTALVNADKRCIFGEF